MTTEDNHTPDPFDLAALTLPQNFIETGGGKKLPTSIPVDRPNKQVWFRIHPDEKYRKEPVAIVDLKESREKYLVHAHVLPHLSNDFDLVTLYTGVTRQENAFLWPVRLPKEDRRGNSEWSRTAREAAELAMREWIRLVPNLQIGAYEIVTALNRLSEPVWLDLSFQELLRIAFRHRVIDREDHPVILQFMGLE